jgi:hypothetical protein
MILAHNLNTRDEAAGAGHRLAAEANEGAAPAADRPAGAGGQSRTQADHIIRLGAGAEALGLIISARQSIRALACGPSG